MVTSARDKNSYSLKYSGLQNKLSIDEFKEERLAEKLKLTSLETMSKIDSLKDEIEFLKQQQPEEHIKDEIALLENELTGSFSEFDFETLRGVFRV